MKIFLMLFTLLLSLNASDWMTYKQMYYMNKDHLIKKPILVFIGAEHCSYCKREMDAINKNIEFKQYIVANFDLVYIDQDNDFVPASLISQVTPTYTILNPGSLSKAISQDAYGEIPLKDFENWLVDFNQKYKEALK